MFFVFFGLRRSYSEEIYDRWVKALRLLSLSSRTTATFCLEQYRSFRWSSSLLLCLTLWPIFFRYRWVSQLGQTSNMGLELADNISIGRLTNPVKKFPILFFKKINVVIVILIRYKLICTIYKLKIN